MTLASCYTVSVRNKPTREPVISFLHRYYPKLELSKIDSVFGFLEPCTLYGGRPFIKRQISQRDVASLYENNIALRIPLTNHLVDEREFEVQHPFLKKYHRQKNAIIVSQDKMVPWIRRDFPQYQIEASLIKNLKTIDQIKKALSVYDTVVLPMELSENYEFLQTVPDKERITLFGNGGCALTCPARICYATISRINKLTASRHWYKRVLGYPWLAMSLKCSQDKMYRKMRGNVDFNLERLQELGFHRFKLLRPRPQGNTCY